MSRSRAQRILLLSNVLPRRSFSSSAPLGKTIFRSAPCGVNTSSSPPSFSSLRRPGSCGKSVSYGLAGAYSFSMGMTTVAEAKDMKFFEPKNVILYQYEACPFCNKVRAFLDFHDILYNVVEVNPLNKKEIMWSDYKKVPILVVDGEQLVDSSDIIDKLSERIHPKNSVTDDEESKWRGWVDDHLVHMLSPNIYRSPSEAIESFDYITSNGKFSLTERITVKYVGAAAMYLVSKKLKKRHNITDERRALYDAVETWLNAIDGRDFHGGSKPNLADLAVFGVLRPVRHLKAGKDMVENTHIGDWFNKMEASVGKTSRSDV